MKVVRKDKTVTNRDYGTTSSGELITSAQMEAWEAEAEAGYDPAELTRRGRPRLGPGASTVVPVRLDPDLEEALTARGRQDTDTVPGQ
jgi:hypothetical protein